MIGIEYFDTLNTIVLTNMIAQTFSVTVDDIQLNLSVKCKISQITDVLIFFIFVPIYSNSSKIYKVDYNWHVTGTTSPNSRFPFHCQYMTLI